VPEIAKAGTKRPARGLAALVIGLALAAPAWAGFDDGARAYGRGDYAAAFRQWKPLAEQGNALAQYNLGVLYGTGQGVARDDAEALKWLRLAARQGNAAAQARLGVMHEHGQGVPQDYAEARKWYRVAAEKGDAEAMTNLGVMYSEGHGVPVDLVRAHVWFNLAAAKGGDRAAKQRGVVTKMMTPAQLAEARRLAREWLAIH